MLDWDLYLLTEQSLSNGRSTLEVVEEAVEAGVDVIQLRDKSLSLRDRYLLGKEIRKITRENNICFIVNDRVDLALALDADGVHLGQDDLPLRDARKILGEDKIIGITALKEQEIREAEKWGADYLGIGSVYRTSSKKVADYKDGIGLSGVRKISEMTKLPITAIGGLNLNNAAEVVRAGADTISVLSAVSKAQDIIKMVKKLKNTVKKEKDLRYKNK